MRKKRKNKRYRKTREDVNKVLNKEDNTVLDELIAMFDIKAERDRNREESEHQKLERQRYWRSHFTPRIIDYKRNVYFQANEEEDKKKAYLVTFTEHSQLLYVAFTETRDKARAAAQRYMRDMFYPLENINKCPIKLSETRAVRAKNLDKYREESKIPIPELMKLEVTFPCSCCGKDNFDYKDYEIGRCFIIEGEGDLNFFTKGMVVCYECKNRYFN